MLTISPEIDVLRVNSEKDTISQSFNPKEQMDFFWVRPATLCYSLSQADQEEPHRTRRQMIQKAHPEVANFLFELC